MLERITDPDLGNEEKEFDRALRPKALDDFVGQESLKELLYISIEAAKRRKEPLDHVLLYGPPGLGKTTLANIIATELGTSLKLSSGPVIEKPGDLAGIMTNLEPREVLFIDEIHRLNNIVEEYMYSALEDFRIEIVIDSGPSARTLKLDLSPFSLIGATTRAGLLTEPLRARFGIVLRLNYYEQVEIEKIIYRSAKLLDVHIEKEGATEIARRSRGTPRVANRLLRRVRDYAQIRGDGVITNQMAVKALEMLNVDHAGLDEMDIKILRTMIENYRGGPVGLKTISVAVGEDAGTLEEIFEPYLIQQGFLERTPQGRKVTLKAYKHLGIVNNNPQLTLNDLYE